MERKLFVIGERDAVLGFALAGVAGFATDDPDAAMSKLETVRRDPEIGLILITSALAGRLPDLQRQRAGGLPLLYEIPGREGRAAHRPLRDVLRMALGIGV